MTHAIVLSLTRYSDTGCVVHLYTAEYGRMQYVVYGNKYKGILRPLSIIEFTSSKRKNSPKHLETLSSVSLVNPPEKLATDVTRHCVALFITEVLSSTLRHPMSDQPIYDWLCGVIEHLDKDSTISNLHLEFLIDFATYLGIGIDETEHPEWFVIPQSRKERQDRLHALCAYYEEHIEDFRTPKSLDVLMEVFD